MVQAISDTCAIRVVFFLFLGDVQSFDGFLIGASNEGANRGESEPDAVMPCACYGPIVGRHVSQELGSWRMLPWR